MSQSIEREAVRQLPSPMSATRLQRGTESLAAVIAASPPVRIVVTNEPSITATKSPSRTTEMVDWIAGQALGERHTILLWKISSWVVSMSTTGIVV